MTITEKEHQKEISSESLMSETLDKQQSNIVNVFTIQGERNIVIESNQMMVAVQVQAGIQCFVFSNNIVEFFLS